MQNETILIIANTGKTGRRVEQRLQQLGYHTRGVSRHSIIAFDWFDSSTWPAAMAGCSKAYVCFQPDLAIPAAAEIIRAFCKLAGASGIEHIVLLSGRGEQGAQHCENLLINSGLTWNIVRASWFAQNFSEGFMLEAMRARELILPQTFVLEPFIDVDDIAEVAVAALIKANLNNRVFEVTGPRLMSFSDCINEINQATGLAIRLKTVPLQEYLGLLNKSAMPAQMQWLMHELFSNVFDGRNAHITDGVRQALGRDARDFKEYIDNTRLSGVWQLPQQQALTE